MCNLPTCLDLSNLNQAVSSLRYRLADDLCALCFSFGSDDVRLPLLLCPLDDESCPFRILLGDLLLLDGTGEFSTEGHVRNGNVFEGDVELLSSAEEIGTDTVRDSFSLRDELGGVELSDDGFEDFIADGGEDTLVVILTK